MSKRNKQKNKELFSEKANRPVTDSLNAPQDIFDNKAVYIIALIIVFLIAALIRIDLLNVTEYRGGADEGFYVRYGAYMAQEKNASIKALIGEYISNKEWQVFPNPLRAGHIFITSWWMRLIHKFDFEALSYLSCLCSILTLFIGYLFAKRLFDKKTALFTLILLAASPLSLAMGRRALQDSVVYLFVLTAVFLFYETLYKKRAINYILFAGAFFISIMVKETSVLLAPFFFLYAFTDKLLYKKDIRIIPALSVVAVVMLAVLAVYLNITGSIAKLFELIRIILSSPATNEYALQYQTGSIFRYVYDFFLISPLTLILCLTFLTLFFVTNKYREGNYLYIVFFFIVLYVSLSIFSKNLRYVMALDFPIRISSVFAISYLSSKFFVKKDWACLAMTLGVAISDILIFRYFFLTCRIYDPVTINLLSAWKTL